MDEVGVVIVDDDATRRARLKSLLESVFGESQCRTWEAANARDGLQVLREQFVDVVVLDLVLPESASREPDEQGSDTLLAGLKTLEGGRLPETVIGITAHDDLIDTHRQRFTEQGWILIATSANSPEWMGMIVTRCAYVAARKRQSDYRAIEPDGGGTLVIAALDDPELAAVLRHHEGRWTHALQEDLNAIVYELDSSAGSGVVRACAAPTMGSVASASLAGALIHKYRPSLVAMTGVAAGLGADVGDVVIASKTWELFAGKIFDDDEEGLRFEPSPERCSPGPIMQAQLATLAKRQDILDRTTSKWPAQRPDRRGKVWFGPVATSPSVIESELVCKWAKQVDRKVVALDMECYGVMYACQRAASPPPECVWVKGIMDRGRTGKGDEWKSFAAFCSAELLWYFLEHMWLAKPAAGGLRR